MFMKILAVNPYVYDFSYYDLYAKPYGLLLISTILRKSGHDVTLIDIPYAENYIDGLMLKRKKDGTGEFYKEEISKEVPYKKIKRRYFRYGLPEDNLFALLNNLDRPDLILITSMMTYWYPGVRDTISLIKERFDDVPVYLGGVYATLLPEHAKVVCKPDFVIIGNMNEIFKEIQIKDFKEKDIFPELKAFYKKLYYIPVVTSLGCPFRCRYCVSNVLNKRYLHLNIELAYDYLIENAEIFQTDKVAFLDDALLYNKEGHIYRLMRKIIKNGDKFSFYTPNGLHIRYIDEECAELMYGSGFKKMRLSLEFADDLKNYQYGKKTDLSSFELAVKHLHKAGFRQEQIGVYLLTGLSGQSPHEVKRAIDYVYDIGGLPYLSEYSPVPASELFEEDKGSSKYDLDEPLYHNNSIFPMESECFRYQELIYLKNYNREKRNKILR